MKTLSRRVLLRGFGGAVLALPFLESVGRREARAAASDVLPFAFFLRQANGVAAAQNTSELGQEPERFWPSAPGVLTPETLAGRALEELVDHRAHLLCVKNVNMEWFDYGDGHARGALQVLTARGPVVVGAGGDSEADGESLDHRIGRELNPDGRDSLFLYAGYSGGWLGGPCISYRGSANRRSPLHRPYEAYQFMVGDTDGLTPEAIERLAARNQSVNDLVRGELKAFLARNDLSTSDKRRLELHLDSVRDVETSLTCRMAEAEAMKLDGLGDVHESTDGDEVFTTVRAHMDVAALAIACGYTRSVALQVGNGNDGATRYRNPDTGALMENYHYISHRRVSHDAEGEVIADADVLHHAIDRQFAQAFKYLLDKLTAYEILDNGVCAWVNDLGNGPAHSANSCPVVLAGSCGGVLKQGQLIELDPGKSPRNHARVLNAIGSAVGLRDGEEYISDFGDPELDRTPHTDLFA